MPEVNITTEKTPTGERILGKFDSQADLVNAYRELERKLSQSGQTMTSNEDGTTTSVQPTATSNDEPLSTPESSEETSTENKIPEEGGEENPYGEAITSAVSAAGLDIDSIATEFASEAGLSEATRTALDGAFGKSVVDAYFKGVELGNADVKQATEQVTQAVQTAAGGEEGWMALQTWASGPNADTELVDTFNEALESGKQGQIRAATLALRASYEAVNGPVKESSVVSNVPTNISEGGGYRSKGEMMTAIQDPRYRTDSGYRQDVQARIAKTEGMSVQ